MPCSPLTNAHSSRVHVHAHTCFGPAAADGDGVMQAGSAVREHPGLFITVAWHSSAWCVRVPMQTWACPCFPHLPPKPSVTDGCSGECPQARSHTAEAMRRSRPCTTGKQQSKKKLQDALGSGNQAKNCCFAVLEELPCQEGKSPSLPLTPLPVAALQILLWSLSQPFPRPS